MSDLENQVKQVIEQLIKWAQMYAAEYPDDFKNQRQLWLRVLEIDAKNEQAREAIHQLDAERDTRRKADDLREQLQKAVERKQYPAIIEILGEAEALANSNQFDSLQMELDQLVTEVKRCRDALRRELGMASARIASENYREAYMMARNYLENNVPVAFDEVGIFGPAGHEYDPVDFLRLARTNLLDWSRKKALERRETAVAETTTALRKAIKTLREGEAFALGDFINDKGEESNIFSVEDKEILQETLAVIRKEISKMEGWLKQAA